MKKLIKISTVPESLNGFCKGQLKMLSSFFEVIAISSPLKELKEIEERDFHLISYFYKLFLFYRLPV